MAVISPSASAGRFTMAQLNRRPDRRGCVSHTLRVEAVTRSMGQVEYAGYRNEAHLEIP